jgi:hypothetical protein
MVRGRPGWGGVVWGLLAFKPVWAAAFFLVPFLTRRWRTCITMVLTGIAIAASTLPFVGWQSWIDWLKIGHYAAELYKVDENWVFLSRDLLGIPRRWMLDFSVPRIQRDRFAPAIVGWCIVVVVLEITIRLIIARRHQVRAATGPIAAFIMLSAWMSCFHFMYYDVLLTALPVFLLCTEPRRFLYPIHLAIMPIASKQLPGPTSDYFQPGWAGDLPPPVQVEVPARNLWVWNRFVPTMLALLLVIEHVFPTLDAGLTAHVGALSPRYLMLNSGVYVGGFPWDTFCMIVLWLWCGWQWLKQGRTLHPNQGSSDRALSSPPVRTTSDTRITSAVHPA